MAKKKNAGAKLLIILLIVLIVVAGALLAIKIMNGEIGSNGPIDLGQEEGRTLESKKETINIFSGTNRPIAVMIDNVGDARPQAGLNKAYSVYEIIVEGGLTRLLAVFKSENVDKIGPVRSARHYFLDYALENDAIYVHFGWSPQAEKDIPKLSVNNINGISESSTSFWRVTDKTSPHNVLTSTSKVLEIAEKKKYKTTSNKSSVLNYRAQEIELETGIVATDVKIPYSTSYYVNYKYDETSKRYDRYVNGAKQKDYSTSDAITTKNIIITFAQNSDLADAEDKGRQNLSNIGELEGYYITNGKAIKIKCTKPSRSEKTIYKDLDGNVLDVNDGNTYFQICPLSADVTF